MIFGKQIMKMSTLYNILHLTSYVKNTNPIPDIKKAFCQVYVVFFFITLFNVKSDTNVLFASKET